MKILLVSVHPVLEYDEIRLFESIGHAVFALGFYFNRANASTLRPDLPADAWHDEMREQFHGCGCKSHVDGCGYLVTADFVGHFDIVIVHHNFRFIIANGDSLRNLPVVWRGIGQEPQAVEAAVPMLRSLGTKIVRWSPAEENTPGYAGADACIRAVKDEREWHSWTGSEISVLSFANNFAARRDALSYDFFYESLKTLPYSLYGLANEGCPGWGGLLSYEVQQEALRRHRVYFTMGTIPASYTLGFIEAWMTGAPMVHLGRAAHTRLGFDIFEVDKLVEHGEDGFIVDNPTQASGIIADLLRNQHYTEAVSRAGREKATAIFGWEVAQKAWSEMLQACR